MTSRIEPDSWDDGPGFGEFLRRADAVLMPKIRATEAMIVIVPEEPDAKSAVELGMAMLLGKPLILIAVEDRHIPEKLEKVADDIIVLPGGLHPQRMHAMVSLSLDRLHQRGVIK